MVQVLERGTQSIRQLANKTGLSKSSVHRHQQAFLRRNQHPESQFWETEAGAKWLARLVIATLYHFGIKNHIGAEQLSDFFRLLRIDTHIGISPSALRTHMQKMERLLPEFQSSHEQSATCPHPERTIAPDEVFFQQMMVLVMMDLTSGYVFIEQQASDRSYETWRGNASVRLEALNMKVRHVISDRAKALIKLALDGFGCHAGADLFHAQYDLSRWFPVALARAKKKTANLLNAANKVLAQQGTNQHEIKRLEEQITAATATQAALDEAHKTYRHHQQAISLAVHPFNFSTGEQNQEENTIQALEKEAGDLERTAQRLNISDPDDALGKFRRQIKDLGAHVGVWWLWINSLLLDTAPPIQHWVTHDLLPVIYWHHQLQRTKNAIQREQYQKAWQEASRRLAQAAPPPDGLSAEEREYWKSWCEDKVKHFHRASSAVEGRNGFLAQMYHNGRGLTANRLKALTVIHNYGTTRPDGTTAATRLFEQPSPDLFEWLLEQTGELPLPRKRRGRTVPNPLILVTVPA